MFKNHRQGVEHSQNAKKKINYCYDVKNISSTALVFWRNAGDCVTTDLVNKMLWKLNIQQCYG